MPKSPINISKQSFEILIYFFENNFYKKIDKEKYPLCKTERI